MVVITLIVGTLIGPVQHIRIEESTSLAKHVAFGVLFAAPLIGDLLGRMLRRTPVLATPLVASVIVALCLSGLHYSSVFRSGWVPNDNLMPTLSVAILDNPNKEILGEQPAPERYALRKAVDSTYWNDTYSFSYAGLTGKRAYKKAIDQSHFGVIYLTMKTTYGKYVNHYLSTHKTPYRLRAKVPRYMRRSYVGDWLIYTPRRSCTWHSKGKCGPHVTAPTLRLKVAESDPEWAS
jgi:hypothetical protein